MSVSPTVWASSFLHISSHFLGLRPWFSTLVFNLPWVFGLWSSVFGIQHQAWLMISWLSLRFLLPFCFGPRASIFNISWAGTWLVLCLAFYLWLWALALGLGSLALIPSSLGSCFFEAYLASVLVSRSLKIEPACLWEGKLLFQVLSPVVGWERAPGTYRELEHIPGVGLVAPVGFAATVLGNWCQVIVPGSWAVALLVSTSCLMVHYIGGYPVQEFVIRRSPSLTP
jgi:hypothetical protein